ncbi:copper chaperone PCu(A)C [Teredinibacter turnerae]|uniref:copper chaperone PCu(A)C n=1 Tax=Teredinibacter turnerae TaxID=2426 RepID=UPI00037077CC|nr:copper chaperone PCu(A)C [Teredinibacter turnerae]
MRLLTGPIVWLLLWLLPGCEQTTPPDPVTVDAAVMPQLPPGQKTAVVYMTLKNNSSAMVTLNYLHSDLSDHIEVHRNIYENGLMKMRPVQHLRLDPHAALAFQPGGYHLMLFDVEDAPPIGQTFDLVLEFEGGLKVTTEVTVKER